MSVAKSKILVVFSRADVTHRKMLEGILRYVRERCADRWQVLLDQRDIFQRSTAELSNGGFSGIIAAVGSAEDRQRYFKTGLPTVLFEPTLAHLGRRGRPDNNVTFFNDHAAEGRAAADYFLSLGFTSFAFVGTTTETTWSDARRQGFVSRLSKDGLKVRVYKNRPKAQRADFTRELPHLAGWLRKLPPQTALLAAHDERALQVLAAAAHAGLHLPEDLAVLGVDDDELLCSTASPSLSSIPVNAEETGERIAEAMHALLEGRPTEPIVRTCHTRIVTRQSTDAYANDNPVVAKALDYIRKHLCDAIGVANLAAAASCSRRTLETKMRTTLGISPLEKIHEIRRLEAEKLLKETTVPVGEVARKCGYGTASHLAASFRRQGLPPPLALRRRENSRPLPTLPVRSCGASPDLPRRRRTP